MPTHLNLNPRTVILFDCHFEIMELLRWVYSNILCLCILCCVLSETHDVLSTMKSGDEVFMHHLKLLLLVFWV